MQSIKRKKMKPKLLLLIALFCFKISIGQQYYSKVSFDFNHKGGMWRSDVPCDLEFFDPKDKALNAPGGVYNGEPGVLLMVKKGVVYRFEVKYRNSLGNIDFYVITKRTSSSGEVLKKWDVLYVDRNWAKVDEYSYETTFKLVINSEMYYDPTYHFTAIYANKNVVKK